MPGARDDAAAGITLRGVTKRFEGTQDPAVDDLTLEVPAGELVVLVGPSGCGKTTTLRMINRLIEPTAGTIEVDGRDVGAADAAELRRGIGYVIQAVGLFPHRTVLDNVGIVPRLLGWDEARITERSNELLELVDLDRTLGGRYPAELSGGQRQRVGVARALAADPPVLLMDEPFGAVDPLVRGRLQQELRSIQDELSKTIVFVTHDVDEAVKLGDRVAVLRVGGRLAQYAPPSELLAEPADEFVADFLGRDRGIRRLALLGLEGQDVTPWPMVRVDADVADARAALSEAEWIAVVDADGALHGWADASRLGGRTGSLQDVDLLPPGEHVSPQDTLRDALDVAVRSNPQVAPLVADGRLRGVLSLQDIGRALEQT